MYIYNTDSLYMCESSVSKSHTMCLLSEMDHFLNLEGINQSIYCVLNRQKHDCITLRAQCKRSGREIFHYQLSETNFSM